ncbi:MAG TPA: SprB repeat-containing protein, partial [Pelobium sp.]|nr:SprB repeat-containing protein [Pelobium sp.]
MVHLYFFAFYSYVKKQLGAGVYFSNSTLSGVLVAFFLIFNVVSADAQVCGTSGIDGPQNAVPPVNTYFPLSPTTSLPAGSQTITLNAVPPNDPNYNLSYGITPIKSGDLILIIQMQDASFDYTNSNLYGAGSATSGPDNLGGTGYTNLNNSGKFEYVVATNDVPLTGGALTFRGGGAGNGCVNTYTNAGATATRGQRRFQVVRVPQYSNLVLTSNITTPPYNGSVGGIIAFDVAGTMQFNGFIVDASARGFRGGYGPKAGSGSNNSTDYVLLSSSTKSVGKGEGIGGTPQYMWDGFNQVDNGSDGLPSGSYGRGAPANGGGGGNDHNSGGGGGGNGGYGGLGGAGWQGANGDLLSAGLTGGGRPGSSLPIDYSRLIMGGGGGGGDANDALSGVTGGVGGGIILINVEKIVGVGVIQSNGGNGAPGTYGSAPDGAGGGGAGGSIFVRSLASSPTADLTLEAKGGNGGNTLNDTGTILPHGPGGGGAGGTIYTQVLSPLAINKDVSKGLSGKTNNGAGISHGATDGKDGQTSDFITADLPAHLQGGGSICYPVLTTTLTEEKPGSTGARLAGTTATYTLTIQNAPTNGNAGNVEAWLNLPSSFKVSSISYALTGDAAGTLNATPHIGASGIMNFGNFNISPGDKVVITIVVDIALNAPTGVYHASAQATYLDPTRTNLNPFRKITGSADPFTGYNTTYESGTISNVIGTNYNGDLLSATAEDVYINALAVTGSCDAITGGGFESYTPGDYASIDKWLPVNSGDVVKIGNQATLKGAIIKNKPGERYSLQQTVISIEPSTAYTLTFNYRNWDACGSPSASKSFVTILDATTNAVIVPQTEFIADNSPAIGSIPFNTLPNTTSVIIKITDAGSPNPACGTFIDDISIVSNLNLSYTVTNVTCNGANNGKVTLSLLTGAAAPYQVSYSLNGGSYTSPTALNPINNSGTPLVFPNLIPGNYEAKIVDANGCVNTRSFNITEPPVLALSETHIDNSCNNNSIGAIDLTVTGGTAPYTYDWKKDGVAYAATQDISSLPPGSYTVSVTDNNSCLKQLSVDILPLTPFALTGSQTNIVCNGSATGAITLNPSGGKAPYSFDWSNASHDQNQTNLIAGNYTVIGKDALGCEIALSFTLSEPPLLTITGTATPILCNGDKSTVTLTAGGGTGSYQYSIDGGANYQSSATFNNLSGGNYTFYVKDANGCIKTFDSAIAEPTLLTLTGSNTPILCYGNKSTVTLSGGGGTGTYQYSIDGTNYQASAIFSNLSGGDYTFYIKDANNCIKTFDIAIEEPAELTVNETHQNINCFGDATGEISVAIIGGTAPYSFTWSNGETSLNQSNLPAGTYTLDVTDANNCTTSKSITITQPPVISIAFSRVNVKCFGQATGSINATISGGTAPYTFEWSNGATSEDVNNLLAGSYSLVVSDANGCLGFASLNITQPPAALTLTETHINNTCFGQNAGSIDLNVSGGVSPYIYSWSSGESTQDLSGLAPGNYTVTVTDANLCTANKTITITPLTPFTLTSSKTDVKCNGAATGEIVLDLSGGTLPYNIIWSNGATTAIVQNLIAGTYTYTATDGNGCQISNTITIAEPAALTTTKAQTDVLCFGSATGAIDITATGGTGSYTYVWDNGRTTEDLTGLTAGTYEVTVTDANGCTATTSIQIAQPSA